MTLPTNDDFANRELSSSELDAISGGGFWAAFGGPGGVTPLITRYMLRLEEKYPSPSPAPMPSHPTM
jgi:hypothetical protein